MNGADFKYKERIEGAQEAIKRSRGVFLILTIVSLAMLITAWNAYFSWTRELPLNIHSWTTDVVAAHAQQHLIDEWVKSQMIDVPLLGIHIGMSDAAPLGGLGVFILSIWFYFSTRRENRSIAELLIDSADENKEVKSRVFHAITSYLIFITTAAAEEPISSLKTPTGNSKSKSFGALRFMTEMLAFLAPFSVLFVVVCDTATIFWLGAPFREGHRPLIESGIPEKNWVEWATIEIIALILASGAALLCYKALQFTRATGKVLDEYKTHVHGAAQQE